MAFFNTSLFQYLLFTLFVLISCNAHEGSTSDRIQGHEPSSDFNAYWYQGEAEVNVYTLKQARYGQMREGQAIGIFVTEPFNTKKQVKNESGASPSTSVFKLNFLKKFTTGVYDYALMTSVFTPVDLSSSALKITHSAQDWCGQSFHQINREDEGWAFQQFSYFESEGDRKTSIPDQTVLEDALLTMGRIHPEKLPTGDIRIFPNSTVLRMLHLEPKPYSAKARLKTTDEFYLYTLETTGKRSLSLWFEKEFPFALVKTEEVYVDGWGKSATELTTTMERDTVIMLPYWKLNQLNDSTYRKSLGLN